MKTVKCPDCKKEVELKRNGAMKSHPPVKGQSEETVAPKFRGEGVECFGSGHVPKRSFTYRYRRQIV